MNITIPTKRGTHGISAYALQSSLDPSPTPAEDSWTTHKATMPTEGEAKTGLERATSIAMGQYHVRLVKVTGSVDFSVVE